MAATGVYLRSITLSIIPVFMVTCFAIRSAPAQQQPGLEVVEYNGTVAAAREAEVAARLEGLLSKINFTAGQLVKQGDLYDELQNRWGIGMMSMVSRHGIGSVPAVEVDTRIAFSTFSSPEVVQIMQCDARLARQIH